MGLSITFPVAGYLDGPPPAHTGGFGEDTCHECHWDHELNNPDGTLTLSGIPNDYLPGQTYQMNIMLNHVAMRRGGFQLTARFLEGSDVGRQAGTLRPLDAHTTTVVGDTSDVEYVQHTTVGSTLPTPGLANWVIEWSSPVTPTSPIIFHVAANAGNDDDSDLGDFVYTTQLTVGRE